MEASVPGLLFLPGPHGTPPRPPSSPTSDSGSSCRRCGSRRSRSLHRDRPHSHPEVCSPPSSLSSPIMPSVPPVVKISCGLGLFSRFLTPSGPIETASPRRGRRIHPRSPQAPAWTHPSQRSSASSIFRPPNLSFFTPHARFSRYPSFPLRPRPNSCSRLLHLRILAVLNPRLAPRGHHSNSSALTRIPVTILSSAHPQRPLGDVRWTRNRPHQPISPF